MTPSPAGRFSRFAVCALLALMLAFGVWLRLDQLADQVLADDEWHALRYLREHDYADVFLHFGISDHCIPMTLLDLWIANTSGLSEMAMRALPLGAGLAALVVLPALVWRRFGTKTTLLFTALLVMSPLHIYFTRYARPYAVVFLLAITGLLAFELFLDTDKRAWAWTYVACAILGPWFQPLFLPFMLAPLAFALLSQLRDRRKLLARARELLPFAAVIVVGLAALLGPPIYHDFDAIRARSGLGHFERSTFLIGYDLITGTERTVTRLIFGAAMFAGVVHCLVRRRALLAYFAFVFACAAGTVVYSMPELIQVPITAVRYVIPFLGLVLLLAADGLTCIDQLAHPKFLKYWPRHLPSTAACIALVAYSPLLSPLAPHNSVYVHPNAWTNHGMYQYQYTMDQRIQWLNQTVLPTEVSNFYKRIARETGVHIIEAPWLLEWDHSPYVYYQRVHRQPMSVGFLHEPGEPASYSELPWPDDRFRFRNAVNLADFDGLRAHGITHVVLHKNFGAEFPNNTRPLGVPIGPTVARHKARFGAPSFEDEILIVFDVRSRL